MQLERWWREFVSAGCSFYFPSGGKMLIFSFRPTGVVVLAFLLLTPASQDRPRRGNIWSSGRSKFAGNEEAMGDGVKEAEEASLPGLVSSDVGGEADTTVMPQVSLTLNVIGFIDFTLAWGFLSRVRRRRSLQSELRIRSLREMLLPKPITPLRPLRWTEISHQRC